MSLFRLSLPCLEDLIFLLDAGGKFLVVREQLERPLQETGSCPASDTVSSRQFGPDIAHAIDKPIKWFGDASMNTEVRKDRKHGKTEKKGTERNSRGNTELEKKKFNGKLRTPVKGLQPMKAPTLEQVNIKGILLRTDPEAQEKSGKAGAAEKKYYFNWQ